MGEWEGCRDARAALQHTPTTCVDHLGRPTAADGGRRWLSPHTPVDAHPLAAAALPDAPEVLTSKSDRPLQALATGYHWADRLRMRHLPLVKPLPFWLGHMWVFRRTPMYLCYERWMKQYGGLFLVFFGKNPVVVLSGEFGSVGGAGRRGVAAAAATALLVRPAGWSNIYMPLCLAPLPPPPTCRP